MAYSENNSQKYYKNTRKNYNSKQKKTTNKSYEFSSYCNQQSYSNFYFGLNIFDLYTREQLADLVKDPMNNNKILREISLILYGTNGIFTNTVDYMTAIPTLDKIIVSHGSNTKKKKRNKELMESVLREIKDKEIVRDALWRGMIDGVAYYYFETAERPKSLQKTLTDFDILKISEINELGTNVSIFSLPADYTEIVDIKNNSYVIAFNLNFFTEVYGESPERKLKRFPKEIREAYMKRQRGEQSNNWIILDNTKTIVHKIRSQRSEKYGRPLVLAAISDILYNDYFNSTKQHILDEINNKIIYQTFPEGQEKGICALTQNQQEKQHNTVKSAVMNKNNRGGVSFFSVAAGTKLDSLDINNTDIFDDKYESDIGNKIAQDMGIAGSLLDGSSSGSYAAQENNLELLTAQLFQWIDQITSELNKCISANIIKDNKNWVECKYLPMTFVNKGKMVGYMKDLYLQGKGSLVAWASACGLSSDVFFTLLDYEKSENIEDKYPVHKTSYTLTTKDSDKVGRPTSETPTENTLKSRQNNGNKLPSPSDKK